MTANSPISDDVTNTSIVALMSDISRIRPEGTVSTVNCKDEESCGREKNTERAVSEVTLISESA